jgi:hypothetical protein
MPATRGSERRRQVSIFISPHNDDETLFGAFTILREKPLVVIVFDRHVQEARGLPVDWKQRRDETRKRARHPRRSVCLPRLSDADPGVTAAVIRERYSRRLGRLSETSLRPGVRGGRARATQHGCRGRRRFRGVRRYLTYTTRESRSRPSGPDSSAGLDPAEARGARLLRVTIQPTRGWVAIPTFLRDQTEYYL